MSPLVVLFAVSTAAHAGLPPSADTFHAARARARAAGAAIPGDVVVQRELAHLVTRAEPFTRRALARRPDWAPLVDAALADAHLPAWLAAVPLVESGYSNWGAPGHATAASMAPGTIPGRGLWMFIPQTARTYGLTVDDTVDERLDPELETAAAVALLTDLHTRFGDWGLALAAYNQGSRAVERAVEIGETDDVLRLIEAGHLNPYAARVMAAALVLADPTLLD